MRQAVFALIKLAVPVLALLMPVANIQAQSKVYQWRLAQTWGEKFLTSEAPRRMSELAEQLSGGRLKISIDTREVHKKPLGIFDMVQAGEYQMGHSASNYWRKKDPDTMFFSSVPFGMITAELYPWFYEGGGLELMNRVYAKHGLMSFPGGNSGHQMIGWFNKEIKSLDDLNGLRLRLVGLAGEVMKELGVDIVNLPTGKLKQALADGQLDAVEFAGPAFDLNYGFQEVAKYYYTGWHSPSSEAQFLVNPEAYEKLPADLQYILRQAMRLAAYDMSVKIAHHHSIKMQELRAKYPNIVLRSFPADVMRALGEKTRLKLQELAGGSNDGLTQEIIQSMDAYKNRARLWTRFSDQAYLNNVVLF